MAKQHKIESDENEKHSANDHADHSEQKKKKKSADKHLLAATFGCPTEFIPKKEK